MTATASKREGSAQQIARLVAPPEPDDEFTLIETLIAELRAMPKPESIPTGVAYWDDRARATERRNARTNAARAVAWEQIAKACLENPKLGHYLRKAGL